jgi:hypothetical protein
MARICDAQVQNRHSCSLRGDPTAPGRGRGRQETDRPGALAPMRVDPLDKKHGWDTIFSNGGSEGPLLMAGTSLWQQPCREELCDGYASLLLSAPFGCVSRRRVCCAPSGYVGPAGGFLWRALVCLTCLDSSGIKKPAARPNAIRQKIAIRIARTLKIAANRSPYPHTPSKRLSN